MPDNPHVLVLGTADWDQPIATNQHYVVRELCRDGFADVTFVESMALRAPQISVRDARRIWARIARVARRNRVEPKKAWRERPDKLKIKSPLNLPWHRGIAAPINRRIVRRLAQDWIDQPSPRILWAYTPVTYGLEKFADSVVYHCVDLLGEVPGIDARVIDENEAHLAQIGALSIATSQAVRNHLRSAGHVEPILWENVADTEIIEAADPVNSKRQPRTVIFAGNLSPTKVDYGLLIALASAGLKVKLAGPRAEGGGNDDEQFAALLAAGVEYLGVLTLPELSEHLTRATVGLIPYTINSYTAGVSPLKTYEYLAAGLPVVSTDLPGVKPSENDIFVHPSHREFVDRALALASELGRDDIERRLRIAREHSWSGRGEAVRSIVGAVTVP